MSAGCTSSSTNAMRCTIAANANTRWRGWAMGQGIAKPKLIAGIGGVNRSDDVEFFGELPLLDRAVANPDVLSDEQSLWPRRDEEAAADREDAVRTLKVALVGLTARQRQVLEAVRVHKSQTRAAFALGISQPVVKKTLNSIRKKLGKRGVL